MLSITLQDLRFRGRQFLIAIVGAGLVFAMTLLLTGLATGFRTEVLQTVDGLGAQTWVVAQGTSGRMAGLAPLPSTAEVPVSRSPGVRQADPVVIAPEAAVTNGSTKSIVVIGHLPGGLGAPTVTSGRPVEHDGEAVVDARLKMAPGQVFTVSGKRFSVVGVVDDRTLLGGVSDTYVTLSDAQAVSFGGRPLVNAILVRGRPSALPAGLEAMTNAQIENATIAMMAPARSSIENSRAFAWVIAAVIVAALVYVSALERTRDFAVLKAIGSTSRALFFGLAIQAVLVALIAAVLAAAVADFMTGLFSQPVDIPSNAYVVLPVSAVVVGLVASLAALRRAVSADPSKAFA